MDPDRLWLLQSALEESRAVRDRLFVVYDDHLDRTAKLLQVVLAVLGAMIAIVTVIFQAGLRPGPAVLVPACSGAGAVLAAGALLAASYAGLPHDLVMSQGPVPGRRAREAVLPGMDRERWLQGALVATARQVDHNAVVIARSIQRRAVAIILLGSGVAVVAVSAFFIVGGPLLG